MLAGVLSANGWHCVTGSGHVETVYSTKSFSVRLRNGKRQKVQTRNKKDDDAHNISKGIFKKMVFYIPNLSDGARLFNKRRIKWDSQRTRCARVDGRWRLPVSVVHSDSPTATTHHIFFFFFLNQHKEKMLIKEVFMLYYRVAVVERLWLTDAADTGETTRARPAGSTVETGAEETGRTDTAETAGIGATLIHVVPYHIIKLPILLDHWTTRRWVVTVAVRYRLVITCRLFLATHCW